jgi:hypothetical protein
MGGIRLGLALAVLAAVAQAEKPPLEKAAVLKLLKPSGARSVSQIFADVGGGRFPVLFVKAGKRDCQSEQNCSATTVANVALIVRDATGALSVESQLELPTRAPAWDQNGELKWGITNVKDYDGDGKPELMIVYGYNGPVAPGAGDTWYRELALVNLDKPIRLALRVTLDEKPQAMAMPAVETKWKWGPAQLELTRRTGEWDSEKSDRNWQSAGTTVWRWDAAQDQFLPPSR